MILASFLEIPNWEISDPHLKWEEIVSSLGFYEAQKQRVSEKAGKAGKRIQVPKAARGARSGIELSGALEQKHIMK